MHLIIKKSSFLGQTNSILINIIIKSIVKSIVYLSYRYDTRISFMILIWYHTFDTVHIPTYRACQAFRNSSVRRPNSAKPCSGLSFHQSISLNGLIRQDYFCCNCNIICLPGLQNPTRAYTTHQSRTVSESVACKTLFGPSKRISKNDLLWSGNPVKLINIVKMLIE